MIKNINKRNKIIIDNLKFGKVMEKLTAKKGFEATWAEMKAGGIDKELAKVHDLESYMIKPFVVENWYRTCTLVITPMNGDCDDAAVTVEDRTIHIEYASDDDAEYFKD